MPSPRPDQPDILYHHKKDRKQLSNTFIRMAVGCWVYMVGLYVAERYFGVAVPDDFLFYGNVGFLVASVVLLGVVWWLRTHPATYEATITHERFTVRYPGAPQWSFDVKLADIKRFENRNTLSHAGKGIPQHGILLHDGSFHHISMNYGNNINDMHKAVQSVVPGVAFPKRVNMKVSGPLAKEYDD